MQNGWKLLAILTFSFFCLGLAACLGSLAVPFTQVMQIAANRLLGLPLPAEVSALNATVVWNLRMPRACLAFLTGAALAASGTVMQSVLRNPLASSYTLGVSSGASLGAAIIIISGFSLPILGRFTLPAAGLLAGLLTVVLAVSLAARVDKGFSGNTIILTGMVFSLFVNALLTLIAYFFQNHTRSILQWQMGSFALKDWSYVALLAPIVLIGVILLLYHARELDLLTFGEEQAAVMGVETTKVKWRLLSVAAALTGSAVAFCGVIGFIDLIAPHVVRRWCGASHRWVVPVSALFGGCFMVLADLVARTIISPSELPVGAITALIGAPFFAYIYFKRRK